MDSAGALTLIIRIVHVGAMSFLLGGSISIYSLSRKWKNTVQTDRLALLLMAARIYEMNSWIATGLIVLTGIGNLGAFGAGLPGASTRWGTTLMIKLVCVFLFVLVSLFRSLLILNLRTPTEVASTKLPFRYLSGLYAITSLLLLAILVLAITLAHG